MQQSFQAQQPMQNCGVDWVGDEFEARAKPMPAGVNQYAMFDANQPRIYLKSINQMGMPNPMKILRYVVEGEQQNLPAEQNPVEGVSGSMSGTPQIGYYVTKDDLNQMKNELQEMIRGLSGVQNSQQPMNHGQNNQNGGGNQSGVTSSTYKGGNRNG
jgi:hypothetical protein